MSVALVHNCYTAFTQALSSHNIDFNLTITFISLIIAVISLIATTSFFHHQNRKAKQHQCLDEIIKRIDKLVSLAEDSFKPDDHHYQLYADYIFQKELLTYSIEKFNKSEPLSLIRSLSKKHRESERLLIEDIENFFEKVELETPIESPSNSPHDLTTTDAKYEVTELLKTITADATLIVRKVYEKL